MYAVEIKHVEIAYSNIFVDIPEYPYVDAWAPLLACFLFWSPPQQIVCWSVIFPFSWNVYSNMQNCKTFYQASHSGALFPFSLFPAFPFLIVNLPLEQDFTVLLIWVHSLRPPPSFCPWMSSPGSAGQCCYACEGQGNALPGWELPALWEIWQYLCPWSGFPFESFHFGNYILPR